MQSIVADPTEGEAMNLKEKILTTLLNNIRQPETQKTNNSLVLLCEDLSALWRSILLWSFGPVDPSTNGWSECAILSEFIIFLIKFSIWKIVEKNN